MVNLKIGAALTVLLLLSTACGDADNVTVKDGGEVVIHLTEYSFTPSTIEVTAGSRVTFVVRNDGKLKHEFMIGRTVRVVDGVKSGFEVDLFEGMEPVVDPAEAVVDMGDGSMSSDTTMAGMAGDGGHGEHGFMIKRGPGEEAAITINIPTDAVGEWEFGCFVEDGAHYEKGMQGTLIVVEG